MLDIVIEFHGRVNVEALDETLRTALGEGFAGLTTGSGRVVLHVAENTPPEVIGQARGMVSRHDPTQFSTRQQAEQQRRARLQRAREQYRGSDLDPAVFDQLAPEIALLARKVAWLEQEIADLRGEA